MSDDEGTISEPITTASDSSKSESIAKAQTAIESLSLILGPLPPSLSSSENPSLSLFNDSDLATKISSQLRQPNAGSGDNNLCRWLYDTFQSSEPNLQLVVLKFVPIITGVYLSRAIMRKSQAGFEAVLLALYAHETTSRGGNSSTVNIPDLSHSSLYHETKEARKSDSTGLSIAVLSPSLEPHGTVRSTKRARIVGVALELYYSKISSMPIISKIDFCEFCMIWAGQNGDMYKDDKDEGNKGSSTSAIGAITNEEVKEENDENKGRVPLPWELLQPILRVLSHCLMGLNDSKELKELACAASRSLYARALHDVDPRAMLATGSLLRLGKMTIDSNEECDPTEIIFDSQGSVTNL